MDDEDHRFRLAHYDYALPDERIAQVPAEQRDGARLLVQAGGSLPVDAAVRDLPEWLQPGDLLVLNDTRVVPARLFGFRERTKGRAEALLLNGQAGIAEVLLKTRGTPAVSEWFSFGEGRVRLEVLSAGVQGRFTVRTEPSEPSAFFAALEAIGRLPLPPYIRRPNDEAPEDPQDRERYQTIFARADGAIAAPTAGLHFTQDLLARCAARGVEITRVTLHVGLGTFLPIQVADVRDHAMHEERYVLPEEVVAAIERTRARGGRVVAVGTTVVRVLEACAEPSGSLRPGEGRTRLLIAPGYPFRVVDVLFTNFHAPKSTLLLLLAAFVGDPTWRELYAHALAQGYRFLSYGDAMLVQRTDALLRA